MPPNPERADLQLLLTVISVHEVKIDYAAVTAALGFGCSPRAVEERLKKIKKRARLAFASMASPASNATKSPVNKKRKASVSTPTPQKKAKKDEGAKEELEDDDVDNDEEEGGVKLEMGGETNFELSNLGTQGCRMLLDDGLEGMLAAEMEENDTQYGLLPYEEDTLEEETSDPRVI